MGRTSHHYLPTHLLPTLSTIKSVVVLIDSSVGAAVRDVTYPPVVRTWGGWGSTCGSLYRSHHRTGAGPGRAHQTSAVWSHSTAVGDLRSTHVVLRGSTHVAALALYALPAVRLHSRHHYGSELQAGWVACAQKGSFSATKNRSFQIYLNGGERTWAPAVGAGHQLFWLAGLVVGFGVAQAEVTVIIWQCDTIWTFLWSWKMKVLEHLSLILHQIQQPKGQLWQQGANSYFWAHRAEAGQARWPPSHPCPRPPPRRGGSGRSGNWGQDGFCSASHRLPPKSGNTGWTKTKTKVE